MWEYGEAARLMTMALVTEPMCIYCKGPMARLPSCKFELDVKVMLAQVSICAQCGWWQVYRIHQNDLPRTAGYAEDHSGTIGCLKELDLDDLSLPLRECRQYFLAKGDSMYDVHPKLFEDVVCSVFKDFGWSARATAYSCDNGIDVILEGESSSVGVQVKRYAKKRKIEAEQIRSLAGALILGGHTTGIFVTTSGFRKGAKRTAEKFTSIGQPIELVDAPAFLDALGIVQRNSFDLTWDQVSSYIVTTGLYLGTGEHQEYVAGEDISERPIHIQVFTSDELMQLENGSWSSAV